MGKCRLRVIYPRPVVLVWLGGRLRRGRPFENSGSGFRFPSRIAVSRRAGIARPQGPGFIAPLPRAGVQSKSKTGYSLLSAQSCSKLVAPQAFLLIA